MRFNRQKLSTLKLIVFVAQKSAVKQGKQKHIHIPTVRTQNEQRQTVWH